MESKLGIAVGILAGIALAVLGILDLPPVSWINDLQISMFGGYSMRVTLIICVVLVLVPAALIGSLFNRLSEAQDDPAQRDALSRKLTQKPFERRDEEH